jgi:hypothetical protein
MAQVQAVWNKLNARERLVAIGAAVVILGWLIGAGLRVGIGSLGLFGGIAVIAILYLKYANPQINWPAPVPLLTLGISAIVALLAALLLLDWIGYLDVLGARALLSLGLNVVGAALMLWGAWQEYQVEKPAMPSFSGTSASATAAPAAPAAEPAAPAPAAPAAEPAAPAPPPPPASDAGEPPSA